MMFSINIYAFETDGVQEGEEQINALDATIAEMVA